MVNYIACNLLSPTIFPPMKKLSLIQIVIVCVRVWACVYEKQNVFLLPLACVCTFDSITFHIFPDIKLGQHPFLNNISNG